MKHWSWILIALFLLVVLGCAGTKKVSAPASETVDNAWNFDQSGFGESQVGEVPKESK